MRRVRLGEFNRKLEREGYAEWERVVAVHPRGFVHGSATKKVETRRRKGRVDGIFGG